MSDPLPKDMQVTADAVARLHALLSDPHPGLFTWLSMTGDAARALFKDLKASGADVGVGVPSKPAGQPFLIPDEQVLFDGILEALRAASGEVTHLALPIKADDGTAHDLATRLREAVEEAAIPIPRPPKLGPALRMVVDGNSSLFTGTDTVERACAVAEGYLNSDRRRVVIEKEDA